MLQPVWNHLGQCESGAYPLLSNTNGMPSHKFLTIIQPASRNPLPPLPTRSLSLVAIWYPLVTIYHHFYPCYPTDEADIVRPRSIVALVFWHL